MNCFSARANFLLVLSGNYLTTSVVRMNNVKEVPLSPAAGSRMLEGSLQYSTIRYDVMRYDTIRYDTIEHKTGLSPQFRASVRFPKIIGCIFKL